MNQKQSSLIRYAKACGKVLIAGGYGVLQQQNIGLCLALQTYFYSKAQYRKSNCKTNIVITSQQIGKSWTYFYDQNKIITEKYNQQNPFLQNAIKFVLKYLHQYKNIQIYNSGEIYIQILFDKGFISDKNIKIQNSKQYTYEKFTNYELQYSKTGLGSSACVLVCIVKVLLMLLDSKNIVQANIVNAISQVANLAAQKKIGSNFDISTAVYGTQLYKNVLPKMAYQCTEDFKKMENLLKINPQIYQIESIVNEQFKSNTLAFMVDISKGANTRKMVGNFLKNLKEKNEQIQKEFFQKSKNITNKLYQLLTNNKISFQQLKIKLKQINASHRSLQQKYSKITQTQVEPQGLCQILNNLLKNQQILYAICPGSGGWDAFFVLVQKDRENNITILKDKIYQVLKTFQLQCQIREIFIKWSRDLEVNKQQKKCIQQYLQKNLKTFNE